MRKILMCDPAHYTVSYKINPWMNPEVITDNKTARSQWQFLFDSIVRAGGFVEQMPGKPELPDIVFTANAGVVYKDSVILSNFTHPQRQPETEHYHQFLTSIGKIPVRLPEHMRYEGAGDALWGHGPATGNTLWCGYGWRSSIEAHQEVRRMWRIDTCLLRLLDPSFYHLDTCFCPLRDDDALIYSGAFDRPSYETLNWSFRLIEVSSSEARRFACNALVIDKTVIMPSDCPETKKALESRGYFVVECPMSEFIKSGGACKCLGLLL